MRSHFANSFLPANERPPMVSTFDLCAFGDFRLETTERRLCRGQTLIPLAPRVFDLLLFLVENEGRLLRKDDLLAAVWPDASVEENNLTVAISALRKALGESDEQRFIETVPKTGYRFIAPVTKFKSPASAPTAAIPECAISPEAESPQPETLPTPLVPSPSAPEPGVRRSRSRLFALLGGALVVVLVAAVTLLHRERATPAAPARRLAILPFRNLRGNAADEFLALSLADAVITRLGSLRALTVRPLYDIQKYTSQTVELSKIAHDLAVDAILTGTFIHEEDNLRIAGQMLDGKTEAVLWRGGFDLKYQNLLTVQEKVARQIVAGLALTLSPSEAARLDAAETIDPMAYEYYLRGIDLYAKTEFELASKMLEKSVELAPAYSPAWANLGKAYTASASFLYGGDQAYRKAEFAFKRALALQPETVDARVFMANMFTDTGRVERAVPLLREAVRRNPNHAESHWELGYAYRFAGMLQASATECETARRIDPAVKLTSSTLNSYLYLGLYDRFLESLPSSNDLALIVFYRGLGEYYRKNEEQALARFDQAFQLDGSMLQTHVGKAMSFSMRHRSAESIAILQELESKTGSHGAYDPEAVYKVAQAYALAGDKAGALRVLKRSIETGFFPYDYIAADPLLAALHNEPSFVGLLEAARRRRDAFQKNFF